MDLFTLSRSVDNAYPLEVILNFRPTVVGEIKKTIKIGAQNNTRLIDLNRWIVAHIEFANDVLLWVEGHKMLPFYMTNGMIISVWPKEKNGPPILYVDGEIRLEELRRNGDTIELPESALVQKGLVSTDVLVDPPFYDLLKRSRFYSLVNFQQESHAISTITYVEGVSGCGKSTLSLILFCDLVDYVVSNEIRDWTIAYTNSMESFMSDLFHLMVNFYHGTGH